LVKETMKNETEVLVTWQDQTCSWAAVSATPPGRAVAESPRTAVNRLRKRLGSKKLNITVRMPLATERALARFATTAAAVAEMQTKLQSMQIALAKQMIEQHGLNRIQAGAVVGLSHSFLGKILDGKLARGSLHLPPLDPAAALAEHLADQRNDKKR
jgi:hypothetical protein